MQSNLALTPPSAYPSRLTNLQQYNSFVYGPSETEFEFFTASQDVRYDSVLAGE